MDEVAWVADLFPEVRSYQDVYAHYGMLGPRALRPCDPHGCGRPYAGIGDRREVRPLSDLEPFHRSAFFRMKETWDAGVGVILGSDVGGGTSLSPFATMKAAYEIAQFGGYSLTPEQAFWLSTAGGAEALSLGDRIGRLDAGYEADIVVLDTASTDIIRQRVERAEAIRDVLFAQMILADDRAVRATYAAGCRVHGG
ncbi:MAG: amidohydrolase family protein [Alphaproteobacteria bacterium]